MEKKKILITGANGFIGSFLVEEALRRNYDVYAGVRAKANTKFIADKPIHFFRMDFSDPKALARTMSEGPWFDYIIHNAGLTKSQKKSDYDLVNNQYCQNFIDAIAGSGKKPKKFILVSSLAAYGPGDPDSLAPVKLEDHPQPITAYGRSKLAAEKYLIAARPFPYLIFRPTAVYGPREKDLYLYFKIINRNIETYIGAPIPYLTFIYVKDLVRAIFAGVESEVNDKAYFVTDGKVYDGKLLAHFIKQHLGKKTIRLSVPIPLVRSIAATLEFFYGMSGKTPILNYEKINELSVTNWQCDVHPLQQDLNFKADYDLNLGIYETVKWYKEEKWL
jgi:nucleoside-diphosphate-sugar epimerase